MRRQIVRIARSVYDLLPRPVRGAAVGAMSRLMSRRHVTATVNGLTFDLDLGEVIDFNLYLNNYEREVAAAIDRWTKPGMTVLDIGANIGAHALHLARLVGSTGRVIAFEPTDFAFAKLKRNVALNPSLRVEPVKVALSDHTESATGVDFRASWRTDGSRRDGLSTVDFVRLDDWLAANGVERIDLMKIDIDGHEYPMFAGGTATFARWRPRLLMEAVGPHFNDDARNPYRILESLGYTFNELKSGELVTVEQMRDRLPRNETDFISISMNVLATPPQH